MLAMPARIWSMLELLELGALPPAELVIGLLARFKSDGLEPPSGVCAEPTGAPGATPNIRLGDPGEGAMFRKLLLGKALNALLADDTAGTAPVPKFRRSPSWLAKPPRGSGKEGGLGVGRTGPTGGPPTAEVGWPAPGLELGVPGALGAPFPAPAPGPPVLGAMFCRAGWKFLTMVSTGAFNSGSNACATPLRKRTNWTKASLGTLTMLRASSLTGPCKAEGTLRWMYLAIALTKFSACSYK